LELLSSCLVAKRVAKDLSFAEVVRRIRDRELKILGNCIKVVAAAANSAGIEPARFRISSTKELRIAKGISSIQPKIKPIKLA
jgi:hypothetical protein